MKKHIVTFFSVVILSLTFAVAANAQTDTNSNSNQTPDQKLKIIRKPIPESVGCNQIEGLVRVRVTFDKSAKVTDVALIQASGCTSFDKNSLKAARGIKFEPQTKDGEPLTVIKPVEFKFYRY